jgi:hypothetical protein
MIVEIKKPITKEKLKKVDALLKRKKKTISLKKYAGKIKWDLDSLTIQKAMRNEWR